MYVDWQSVTKKRALQDVEPVQAKRAKSGRSNPKKAVDTDGKQILADLKVH